MAFQKDINAVGHLFLDALFHAKTIGFESDQKSSDSIAGVVKLQWSKLCPNSQHAFAFLMADARVIPAPGMFVVAIKSMTTRKIVGCEPVFHQMTFVLCDFEGKLLCVHVHVSPSF